MGSYARAIVWHMQEKVYGGLTSAIARQLQRLRKVLDEGGVLDLGSAPQHRIFRTAS